MTAMVSNTIVIAIPNNALIQIGANTHHHDQSICSVSFKTINAIVRRPINPIPPLCCVCMPCLSVWYRRQDLNLLLAG
jgi:hypothetical protein